MSDDQKLPAAAEEEKAPLAPSPDLARLVKRYVPDRECVWCRFYLAARCPHLTIDDDDAVDDEEGYRHERRAACDKFRWSVSLAQFEQSGLELVERESHTVEVFGMLIEFGWRELLAEAKRDGRECTLDDEPIRTKTQWAVFCARLFGVSRETIIKAWGVGRSQLDAPADMAPSLWYEIESATDDQAEKERLMEIVISEGWNTWQTKTAKYLKRHGFTLDWELPTIVVEDDAMWLETGGRRAMVAEMLCATEKDLACALALLMRGCGVVVKSKDQGGRR